MPITYCCKTAKNCRVHQTKTKNNRWRQLLELSWNDLGIGLKGSKLRGDEVLYGLTSPKNRDLNQWWVAKYTLFCSCFQKFCGKRLLIPKVVSFNLVQVLWDIWLENEELHNDSGGCCRAKGEKTVWVVDKKEDEV